MKKIILMALTLLVGCITIPVKAALSTDITATTLKNVYTEGETIIVNLNFSNLKTDNGVVAIAGKLKYDTNKLELVSMSGKNSWNNPDFNEKNGSFIMDAEKLTKEDGSFLEIKFKALSTGKDVAVEVDVENLRIANGEDVPVKVSKVSKFVEIKESKPSNPVDDTNNGEETPKDPSSGSDNNEKVPTKPINPEKPTEEEPVEEETPETPEEPERPEQSKTEENEKNKEENKEKEESSSNKLLIIGAIIIAIFLVLYLLVRVKIK